MWMQILWVVVVIAIMVGLFMLVQGLHTFPFNRPPFQTLRRIGFWTMVFMPLFLNIALALLASVKITNIWAFYIGALWSVAWICRLIFILISDYIEVINWRKKMARYKAEAEQKRKTVS